MGCAAILFACLVSGCQTSPPHSGAWQSRVNQELPVLGHRNWLVVADSAYPEQISPGIETIYTGGQQLEVLEAVLKALDHTKHVQPIIHLDAELEHVPESLAPGVAAYRAGLDRLLGNRRILRLPHGQLIGKLDEAGKTFRVLILKTDLTIPYTSVFLQLDCGYWGPDPEKQLREIIGKTRP